MRIYMSAYACVIQHPFLDIFHVKQWSNGDWAVVLETSSIEEVRAKVTEIDPSYIPN